MVENMYKMMVPFSITIYGKLGCITLAPLHIFASKYLEKGPGYTKFEDGIKLYKIEIPM